MNPLYLFCFGLGYALGQLFFSEDEKSKQIAVLGLVLNGLGFLFFCR